MYFVCKDERTLPKILTSIIIFMFLIMICISPVFCNSEISFNDSKGNNYVVSVPDFFYNKQYRAIIYYKYKSWSYGVVSCICSDEPFYFTSSSNSSDWTLCNAYFSSGSFYNTNRVDIPVPSDLFLKASFPNLLDSSAIEEYIILDVNFDLKFDGEIFIPKPSVKPHFLTKSNELATGTFDILNIDMGSFDGPDDSVILNVFEGYNMGDGVISYYPYKSFKLDDKSDFEYVADLNIYYRIPRAKLGIDLSTGKHYRFNLSDKVTGGEIYDKVDFTVSQLTPEEEQNNKDDLMNDKLDQQTDAIQQNTETNKGIWETLKEILSYLNPFSENFFVYKLLELLFEGIKSLFVPSDDFFSNYFTELKNWFSDRLGFLFYPFELIIDVLNGILGINLNEPIFNIPDMYEPVTGGKFISATTFNLNTLIENDILKNVHNIYLVCVDAFIVIGLVNLFKRKYEEVTTK